MADIAFYCPPPPYKVLDLRTPLSVGFGFVCITKDGETVWRGDDERVWLRRFERMAKADPDHDWRCRFYGPLSEDTYQRTPEGWVHIERKEGFA